MTLKKENTLYSRDESGKLIPQEVEVEINEENDEDLEFKGEKIFVTPVPRGKLKKILSLEAMKKDGDESDTDGKLILEYCNAPKYTEDEIPFIKPTLTSIIVNTIFRESGLRLKKASKQKKIEAAEDEFGKNSGAPAKTKKKEI